MCGIVGLVGTDAAATIARLNQSQYHRGPDDAGEYYDPTSQVALAMRRLSIVDLAGGHQPMSHGDGSLWVVFNGEIFNAPELRSRLEAQGCHFKTSHSDTECLLHLYAAYGEAMVQQLNGMFAFVIYDRTQQRLFGARDRFGIKPFYYTQKTVPFAFASELKSLLQLPQIQRQINLQSLSHYLSLRYIPGSDSIIQDIHRLPAAHWCRYDLEQQTLTLQRYWQPNCDQTDSYSVEEWSERIEQELRGAVKRWAMSDVPIGCSLSGGIDSTAVAGLLAESGCQFSTYSLGFAGNEMADWSELPLARQVADRWSTEHHELYLTPDELLADLMPMVWMLEEPYGGGLPAWYVFRFMGQNVKVGLTGTGGDELFGNYGKWWRYEHSQTSSQRWNFRLKQWLAQGSSLLIGQQRQQRWANWYQTFDRPMDSYPLYFDDAAKQTWLRSADRVGSTVDWLQHLYDQTGVSDIRNGVALVDWQTQLAEEFLLMTDRFSMAHSVEARTPFLDHQLVETVLRIPSAVRTSPRDPKYLLKRAIGHLLPPDLLSTQKRGFVIPDTIWLRQQLRPLVEQLLAPDRLQRQGIFDPQIYYQVVQPHLQQKTDYTGQVWTLLMFQLWHTIFIEQQATAAPSFTWQDLV